MSKDSKILIAVLVVIVGAMIGLFMAMNTGESTPTAVGDKTKVIRDNSYKMGTGAVELVEYGDYQCPACGAAHPTVKQLMKDYDGKVTFYFRNFPLNQIHRNANISANAAEAAGAQGKFWEMHDRLYENQTAWSNQSDPTKTFVEYARTLDLDIDKFTAALNSKEFQSRIDQDLADGEAVGVNSTPTFYFNGEKYTGRSSYEELKAKVDSLLGASASAAPATPTATPAS